MTCPPDDEESNTLGDALGDAPKPNMEVPAEVAACPKIGREFVGARKVLTTQQVSQCTVWTPMLRGLVASGCLIVGLVVCSDLISCGLALGDGTSWTYRKDTFKAAGKRRSRAPAKFAESLSKFLMLRNSE